MCDYYLQMDLEFQLICPCAEKRSARVVAIVVKVSCVNFIHTDDNTFWAECSNQKTMIVEKDK